MTSNVAIAWLEGPQNTKFFTRFYQSASPKALIVFIHGFGEHCTRYLDFHNKLSENGISVFTYDQRGFGRTALDDAEKSKHSGYGRTSWKNQMEDMNWAIGVAREKLPGLPVYIMGQSMGGGEVLGFATEGSHYASTIDSLAGVIATSPLVQQTFPVNPILRKLLGGLRMAFPNLLFPADLVPNELSRDVSVGEAYVKDPYVRNQGTLQGIADMLNHGDELRTKRWQSWPKRLPVLFLHGTNDRITSPTASREFHDKISVDANKSYVASDGAFHELSNELPDVREHLLNEVVAFVDKTLIPAPEVTARL